MNKCGFVISNGAFTHSRRKFLGIAAVGATSAFLAKPSSGARGVSARTSRALLLTTSGGDRATGYVMSNKIARRDGHLVCAWLDFQRQNRWALVNVGGGKILRESSVGGACKDNHCGVAVATGADGTLHLLIGAHHAAFTHMRLLPGKEDWEPVEDGRAVGQSATYPSLVCDGNGALHLLYRRETNGTDAHLVYCRCLRNGTWSAPRLLVRLAVREHSWLTNAIEVGPDGRLHAVFSNILPVPAQGRDARYFGGSHIYSDDGGETWRQFGGEALEGLPADAAKLQRIEGSELTPDRIESRYGGERGPLHSYYHKMTLSNPVVDRDGNPWVILHNLLTGDARLYRHGAGQWIGAGLAGPVGALLPGFRIQHCGQLSRHGDGTIEAVVMVSPRDQRGWGAEGTTLARLLFDGKGRLTVKSLIRPPEPGMPSWMPSLERWCWHAPIERPALLYTRGLNAGGYSNNINSVKTEVWVEQP